MQDATQQTTPAAVAIGALQPNSYAPAPAAPAVDPLQQQIEKWKRQHREVHEVSVVIAEGDVAVCYIHNPDRNVLAYAISRTLKAQVIEAGEFILSNCWLGGDERCNPNSSQCFDPAVIAAAMDVAQSIELLAHSSKKL
jgi:hypothetical protein